MNGPQFFEIDAASINGANDAPWADEFYPRSRDSSQPVCGTCGREAFKPFPPGPASAQIVKGDRWTDFIGGTSAHGGGFMVGERVLDAMRKAEITGFQAHPVEFTKVKPKRLLELPIPTYCWLRVHGKTDFDFSLSGGDAQVVCPDCYLVKMPFYPHRSFPLVPLKGTWDGSDLFHMRNRYWGVMYCTMRVLLLARENRWTNARFVPMGMLDRDKSASPSWSIDYLGEKWPPDWYPSGAFGGSLT